MKKLLFTLGFISFFIVVFGQLTVTTGIPAATLVQNTLVGGGVTISNVTYTGPANSIGRFQTGATPTNLGIGEGIIMSSGVVNGTPAIGSPVTNFASTSNMTAGDALLNSLIGGTTNDASVLEFDFTPLSDTIRFRYVFGSEEYPEWVGSSFNDVFGFFVTGPNPLGGTYTNKNIALIPGTASPVSINNIHSGSYSQYYVDNQAIGGTSIVFDGFTTVLTAWLKVVPCQTYHIKLAIADAGDSSYDSAVFLEANSFGTSGITVDTDFSIPSIGNFAVEGCNDAILTFCLPQISPSAYTIPMQVGGSATSGADYPVIPASLTIPAGTLCIDYTIQALIDNLTEGIETIEVIVQTDLCGAVDTIFIDIHDYFMPQLTTSSDTTICIDESANIWAAGSQGITPYTYAWSNGGVTTASQTVTPNQNTTYVVTVTDMCLQTITGDVIITVATTDVNAGNDVTICAGDAANLFATGGTSYLWSEGSTTPNITVSPLQTTSYSVTATGVCIPIDTVTVFVNPLPIVILSQPDPVCAGEDVEISTQGADVFIWSSSPADGTLNGQTTNSIIHVNPNVTTVYTVVATDSNNCINSAQVTALIYPSPRADFIMDPDVVSSFEPIVNFIDMSSGPPETWYWDFGDNQFSDIQHPVHIYSDSGGVFPVTLTVSNQFGCEDVLIKYVTVQPDHVIYIPNSFSPDGDGINDEFVIFSTGVSLRDFDMMIFDRWGNLIFHSEDMFISWDGKYNNNVVQNGVYHYRLLYRDKTNLLHEKFGCITVH